MIIRLLTCFPSLKRFTKRCVARQKRRKNNNLNQVFKLVCKQATNGKTNRNYFKKICRRIWRRLLLNKIKNWKHVLLNIMKNMKEQTLWLTSTLAIWKNLIRKSYRKKELKSSKGVMIHLMSLDMVFSNILKLKREWWPYSSF